MKKKVTKKQTGCLLMLILILLLSGCAKKELYTYREQAVEAFQSGDYEKARELFDLALSYGDGEVGEAEFDILKYRGECELRCRDFDAAEKTYRILLELDDSEENRALYEELSEEFSKVTEINEAFALMETGDYAAAYRAMDQYAGLGGDAVEAAAWFNKAVCTEKLGYWEEAAELFGDYLAIYPEDEEAEKEYAFCSTR